MNILPPTSRFVQKLALLSVFVAGSNIFAANYYNFGNNGTQIDLAAQYSNTDGSTTAATVNPGSADDLFFYNSTVTSPVSLTLLSGTSTKNYGSMTFGSNVGALQINRAASPAGSNTAMYIWSGGITLEAGAGPVTFGGTSQNIHVGISADNTITNNSSSDLTFNRFFFGGTSGATRNVTISGSGSGNIVFPNLIIYYAGRDLAITVDKSGSGKMIVNGNGNYTGATTINAGTLQIGDGGTAGNLSPSSVITVNGTLAFNRTDTLTQGTDFASAISGTGNIVQDGTGTLVLSANNTYTGATTVNAGTLTLSASDSLSDSSTIVVNGGEFALDAVNETVSSVTIAGGTISGSTGVLQATGGFTLQSGTVSGILGGTGSATKSGTGTVVLTGANTYSGGTTVSGGTLKIGNAGITGSLNGTITTQGVGVLEFNRTDATTVSNTLAGNGTFRQIGGNTLTLDGTNTTNGTISVTSGTILFSGAGALPSNGSLSASSNGTLSVADGTTRNSTLAGGLTMSSANFVFDINASASDLVAFSGAASLSGTNLVKLNLSNATAGSWTLMSASSGLDGGTWSLDTDSFIPGAFTWSLSSSSTALTLTAVGSSNNFYWTGNTSSSWGTADNWSSDSAGSSPRATTPGVGDDVFFTATTASNLSTTLGANFTVNTISITDPGVSIAAGNTLTANASTALAFLVSADSGTTTLAASLAGANAGLTKSGNGSLILSGANTYGGGTTINGGTLTISGGAAISDSGAVVLGNVAGTVFSISTSETIASLQGGGASGGNVSIATGQTLTVGETGTNTFSGVIAGVGNLVKTGAGTMLLDGANTYSGSTTISAGTLQIGAGFLTGSINSTSAIANNGELVFNRSNSLTISAAISGSGGIKQLGTGTTLLTANNTYTGATTISAGTLQVGNGGASGSISTTSGIVNNGLLVFNRSSNITLSAPISGNGALTQSGSGTVVLSGSNSYTGTTTIAAGSLKLDNAGAIGGGGSIVFTGGSLVYSANNTVDISSRINSSTSAITIDTNGQNITFASAVGVSNSGGLVKNGTGTLVLAGINAFTGATVVNAGTLQLGNTGAGSGYLTNFNITNNGTLIFNRGSTSSLGGYFISGTGDVVLSSSALVQFTGSGGYTGSGSLIVNNGTLYFDQSNQISNSASLEINGGTFRMGTGQSDTVLALAMTSGSIIADGASNTLTATNGFAIEGGTLSSNVSLGGSGSLTKNGTGTFILSGSNSYSGGTTLNAGTLVIGNTAAAGSGSIVQTSNSSLLKVDVTGTINNAISVYTLLASQTATLSGAVTVNNATFEVDSGDTLTISSTINGTGGVTKNGDGALILSGSNTYSGATTVNAGTLEAANANALGTNAAVTVNGGSLLVSADAAINSKTLTLASSATGNGTAASLVFSGTYNGTAGSLTLSEDSIIDLGTGSVHIHFADIAMGIYSLSIYNWTGTTLWDGGDGNNTDQFYIDRTLTSGELNKISFYSGLDNSSFVGTAYQLSGGSFNNQVIPVPEAETWLAASALLGGAGFAWVKRRRSGKVGAGRRV